MGIFLKRARAFAELCPKLGSYQDLPIRAGPSRSSGKRE